MVCTHCSLISEKEANLCAWLALQDLFLLGTEIIKLRKHQDPQPQQFQQFTLTYAQLSS